MIQIGSSTILSLTKLLRFLHDNPPPLSLKFKYKKTRLDLLLLDLVDHLLHDLLLRELDHDGLVLADNLGGVPGLALIAHPSLDDGLNFAVDHLEGATLEETEVVAGADGRLAGHVGADAGTPGPSGFERHPHAGPGVRFPDVDLGLVHLIGNDTLGVEVDNSGLEGGFRWG